MRVRNVHERVLVATPAQVGALLDSLGSVDDALWPGESWPAMRFDRPLGVGAIGGHGPIRYTVETYDPGRSIRFRFTAPAGFDGTHAFDVLQADADRTVLRHTIDMRVHGWAVVSWPVVYRPLHDALLEDGLDRAELALGRVPRGARWSTWVRLLRSVLGGRRRPGP
jgi:hypothetical protein